MKGIVYLASPYSHPEAGVRGARYDIACAHAAQLMAAGECVFSPIAHSHPIAEYLDDRLVCDFDFWMAEDLPILAACSVLKVLCIDGWKESRGVQREIEFARERGIPVEYIER
jgi:hypothetical protein